jgi:hypothetical protein
MFVEVNFSARVKAALIGTVALGLLAVPNAASAATLLQYNFNGNAGNEAFEPASFVASNLSGLNFTRGSGLNTPTGSNSINSSGFGNYASNPNDYLTFGLRALTGYTATINQLVFSSRSSGTGPRDLSVLAAVNGGAFQQVATFAQTNDSVANRLLSFAPLTSVSEVIFRIVTTSNRSANNGTLASGGTFRIQNYAGAPASPFSINGDVVPDAIAAVPEPASWAMMIGGFGLIGGMMRRRLTRISYAI